MTKVYTLFGMAAGILKTTYCNTEITLNFRNGLGANGLDKAVLVTSSQFIQDAIEADARFGSRIRLDQSFDDEVKAKNEYQVQRTVQPDAAAPQSPSVDDELEAKKAAMREKRKAAAEKAKAKAKAETAGTLTFADVNEAMHYFAGQGIEVTADNLSQLLREHNAAITE